MKHIAEIRSDYTKDSLEVADLAADPFDQFKDWFQEAEADKVDEPNAMCLATAGADGQPSTRIVLLKGFSKKGVRDFHQTLCGCYL